MINNTLSIYCQDHGSGLNTAQGKLLAPTEDAPNLQMAPQFVLSMSQRFEALELIMVLSASLIVLSIIQNIVTTSCIPYPVKQSSRHLGAPFRNFVTLEDVTNPLECEGRSSKSRPRALSVLAFIASASWLGGLVYGIYVENTGYAVKCLISLFEWVRAFQT